MSLEDYIKENREKFTRALSLENRDKLEQWTVEQMDILVETMLGTGDVKRIRSAGNPPDDDEWTPRAYVDCKRSEYFSLNFRYSKIFDLCRVLGIKNLYDIGCCFINQSFLLCDYSDVHYTGIDNCGFTLIDYRRADYKNENVYYPYTTEAPPAFRDGRIRFVKAEYPFKIDAPSNNIAISSYSITNTIDPDEINSIANAFSRDFERVLFNTKQDSVDLWKNSACKCFEFYPIGYSRFVFGTKLSEDIKRLKEIYPFENNRFSTGIDNYWEYSGLTDEFPGPDSRFGYIHW